MSQTGSSNSSLPIPRRYWHIPTDLTNVTTLQDACSTYYYSRNALLRRIKRGSLTGFKIGHRWFVDVSGLKKKHIKKMTL